MEGERRKISAEEKEVTSTNQLGDKERSAFLKVRQ